jgi:hypothetical protein
MNSGTAYGFNPGIRRVTARADGSHQSGGHETDKQPDVALANEPDPKCRMNA